MGDIVQSARNTFFGDKSWVYGQNHGGASNPNAFKGNQADCTYLVYQSNLHAGYNVPYLNTGSLIKNGTVSPEAAKYYDVVDAKDARPGDTVYYPAAAQNANHVMVLTSWDSSKNTGVALGAQSEKSDLKDGIKIGADKDYWKTPTLILRPKAETYVPELDLTGGPGTGIGSARVAAAVNLLKTEGAMEGYRPGIYTDSGGVPTVGNGLALVVNGSKGWTVRSEEEIKGLLRIAGLPESKYDELPLDTLKQAAQDLRSGNTDSARARFGDGRSPDTGEFSVSPLQADRLTAAFIVADTTPKLIAGLGGPTTYNELANGEFAAVAGGTYQNPNWLKNHPDFVKAFKEGDDAAAQAAFGTSKRGMAEAEAYAGHVSTSNENLSPGTSSPGERTTSNTAAGHWEYPDDAYYDPHTGIQVGGSAPVWVSDTASTSNSLTPGAGRGLINPPSVNPDSSAPTLPKLPPTPQISPDGTTALLPNGQVIRAGAGGTLDIDADGNLVVSRPAQGWTNADGSPSDIRQITTYDAKGAQIGTTIAQNLPGESSPVENYAQRTVQVHNPDGSTADVNTHFQADVGWVDDAGKTVLSLKDAQAQLDAKNAHLIPGASADNDYTPGAPTGEAEARGYMGKTPAQQANPDSGGGSDAEPDPQSSQGHGGSDTPSDFHAALLDAFTNPTLPNTSGPATQYAGPGLPDTSATPNPAPATNPNSLSSYFQSQGTALTPKQQAALASQIDQLKLSGSDDLSYYPLPDGSTLIANADGDLVGQLSAPRNGEISLHANAIAEDGSATTHDRTITTDGQTTSYSPHALAQVNAGLSLMQGLDGLQHWDQMGDVARFTSLVGLASSYNTLSDGALGNLGNLGAAASALGLMQALQDGNTAGIISGINGVSGGAIDGALNSAVNSALGTASSSVPYVSIALALNDFEKHVGSSLGTLVGTFFFGGPIGGAIGGMVGGMLDSMFGGSHSPPPPPEGAVHFSWDAGGQIQHTIDLDERGGGSAANQVAAGVQDLLEQVVQAANARHTDSNLDLAINPYLLPRFGVSKGATWMEVTQSDGSTLREDISQEGFAEHLIAILQDNGALAPAWQVATVQGHWAQAQEELADLREQLSEAQQSESPQAAQLQQQINTRQNALDHELHAGIGGHAYAGNEAYSLQGNAAESADFKTQDFGVLVVHVSQHSGVQDSAQPLGQTLEHIQKQALKLSETLRDVENDGYAERTEWVSATDDAGNFQGLLVLDYDSDGLIQTRDILNLGGNAGQAGNLTTEAALATQNAALQRNNVQWLDANGDGVLDAQDPAFAAIKLWVDMNQDGQMQASENGGLSDLGLQSINFKTGEVVYADGGRDALSAATLHADTDGVRLTQVSEVNAQGFIGFGSDNGAICPQLKRQALRMRGFRCVGAHGMPPSYTSGKSTSLI